MGGSIKRNIWEQTDVGLKPSWVTLGQYICLSGPWVSFFFFGHAARHEGSIIDFICFSTSHYFLKNKVFSYYTLQVHFHSLNLIQATSRYLIRDNSCKICNRFKLISPLSCFLNFSKLLMPTKIFIGKTTSWVFLSVSSILIIVVVIVPGQIHNLCSWCHVFLYYFIIFLKFTYYFFFAGKVGGRGGVVDSEGVARPYATTT